MMVLNEQLDCVAAEDSAFSPETQPLIPTPATLYPAQKEALIWLVVVDDDPDAVA